MNKIFSTLLFLAFAFAATAADQTPRPATPAEAAARVSRTTFISPWTLGLSEAPTNVTIENGEIFITTNMIDGLNYAITNLAVATNKMMVGGNKIKFQHGTHYITYPFVYSNTFPSSVTFEGEGLPGVNIVYVGPQTNVDVFQFLGTQSGDGCMLQSTVKGIQFGSVWDTTNFIMQVQGAGWLHFENCAWSAWTIATNNLTRGLAVSEATVDTSFTNLGGLRLSPGDTGAGVSLTHCYFKWLQNGIYDGTDHMLIVDTYFSVIAKNGVSIGWPTNSLFRLGAGYIRDNTPAQIGQTLLLANHWTRDNICILDNSQTSMRFKTVAWGRMESPSNYRYVATNGGGGFAFVDFNDAHNAPDASFGISGTSFALNSTPPTFSTLGASDAIAVGYQLMYPVFNYGLKVDSAGNAYTTGTNNFRGLLQLVNLDQVSIQVSGVEAAYNTNYYFNSQDQRYSDRLNWRTVWTNAANTNAMVWDPLSGVPWALYNVTNDLDNAVYFSEIASIDPPPTSWSQNTGASNSMTVTFNIPRFKVFPNGALTAPSHSIGTNTANFREVTNNFVLNTLYTNLNQRAHVRLIGNLFSTNALSGTLVLAVDQDGDNTYDVSSYRIFISSPANSGNNSCQGQWPLGADIEPNGKFYFTNTSSSPSSSSIISGTSHWIFQ